MATTTLFTSVGNSAECATKRIDGMGEKPQCLYEAGVEPLGRSIQGYQLDVKELPLKGTGAARHSGALQQAQQDHEPEGCGASVGGLEDRVNRRGNLCTPTAMTRS